MPAIPDFAIFFSLKSDLLLLLKIHCGSIFLTDADAHLSECNPDIDRGTCRS